MSESGFIYNPSLTATFQAIGTPAPKDSAHDYSRLKAVVIGGGTGAPVSIRTLLSMGIQTSAVVAMADDGGSTGILREEAHVTPPGDIRKCLAAFAADPDDPLTKAFKYRFEFARNHTLGNLMLSALEEATGSFPEAIKICGQLLGARGRVYPSTLNNVTLCATTYDGHLLRGQAKACKSQTALDCVWLESPDQCLPYRQAIEAIEQADLIVLGPGSLFTSIIPNLLVPGIAEAIAHSKGATVFVCSLADQQGETWGLSAGEHADALFRHGMEGALDYMLIHSPERPRGRHVANDAFTAVAGEGALYTDSQIKRDGLDLPNRVRPVRIYADDIDAIRSHGTVVMLRNMVDPLRPTWHDPSALAQAFEGVIHLCRSRQK